MRTQKPVSRFLTAVLISILSLGSVVVSAEPEEKESKIPEEVRQLIESRIRRGLDKGLVIGIIDKEGTEIVGFGSTSIDSGVRPDATTVFEIGSVTKVFTGLLLAQMSLKGEVKLDQPLGSLLPEETVIKDERVASITLAQLSTHTSGLPRLPSNFAPADPTNPYADYDEKRMLDFLSSYKAGEEKPSYAYSNYGAGLLGYLLARRTESSYEELVRTRITRPLKMPETVISLTPEMTARLAQGYSGAVEASNWELPALAGAGGLRSTVPDLLRFVSAAMGRDAADLDAAMKLSQKPRHEAGSPQMQIGLGWHIRSTADLEIPWHAGGTGGYRSFIGFVRGGERGGERGVVVLSNSDNEVSDIGLHLLDSGFPLSRSHERVIELDQETLESYAGKYQMGFMFFDVEARRGVLVAKITGQSWATLYPESKSRFFYTLVNAQIKFNRGEDGEVDSLTLYQNGMEQRATKLNSEKKP